MGALERWICWRDALTPSETKTVRALATTPGRNEEMAARLMVSRATVRKLLNRAYAKAPWRVPRDTLAVMALITGIVTPDEVLAQFDEAHRRDVRHRPPQIHYSNSGQPLPPCDCGNRSVIRVALRSGTITGVEMYNLCRECAEAEGIRLPESVAA